MIELQTAARNKGELDSKTMNLIRENEDPTRSLAAYENKLQIQQLATLMAAALQKEARTITLGIKGNANQVET